MLVLVHIDDLIILSSNVETMSTLKAKLEAEYEMTNLRELIYCLGVEFIRDHHARTITMNQAKYMEDFLKRFGIEDCKHTGTLSDMTKVKLKILSIEDYDEITSRMVIVPYKLAIEF